MKLIDNKKIALSLFLVSVFAIILANFLREDTYETITLTTTENASYNVPEDYKFIRYLPASPGNDVQRIEYEYNSTLIEDSIVFFGIIFPFKGTVTCFILLLCISIFMFIFSDDNKLHHAYLNLVTASKRKLNRKSMKHTVIVLLILSLVFALAIYIIYYYLTLIDEQRTLTWGESLLTGFCNVFLLVAIVSIIISLLKSIISKSK